MPDAVGHLVGLQAQAPMPPYYGLWSRPEGFDPHELGRLLTERKVVRLTLMRGTVHLVTVDDALALRPLMQGVIERQHSGAFGRRMGGAEPGELARAVRELLAGGALTARELGRRLVERGIGDDVEAIGQRRARPRAARAGDAARGLGPRRPGEVRDDRGLTGRELEREPSIDGGGPSLPGLVRPGVGDGRAELVGADEAEPVLERLRPELVTFRDEQERELFDLPDAPRPGAGHAGAGAASSASTTTCCSARRPPADHPRGLPWEAMLADGRFVNNLLVGGKLRATWWIERDGKRGCARDSPVRRVTARSLHEVAAEAGRLLGLQRCRENGGPVRGGGLG